MTAPQRPLYRFLCHNVQEPQIPVAGDFPCPRTGANGSAARRRSSEPLDGRKRPAPQPDLN